MPRLSLYRPNRTSDYQFLDRTIKEMYTVGGVDLYIHKYLGPQISGGEAGSANSPGDATLPSYSQENPLFIQDLLLLENRDRAYSPDVYTMRGVYNQQDIDFDLTQFGLFLNNDTLFITFPYNYMIDFFGRKLMSGDVLELPNLKDYNPLNANIPKALPKYYVIQDAAFASEGFSQTWLPHLWRVKATPMVNAQEYQQIIDQPFMPDNIWDPGNFYPQGETVKSGNEYYISKGNVPPGTPIGDPNYWTPVLKPDTVGDVMSTRLKDLALNDALVTQANIEVPLSGYDNVKFYILPTTPDGEPSNMGLNSDQTGPLVDSTATGDGETPRSFGYTVGYLTGDEHAPNGLKVTPGVAFPHTPVAGEYALRLDYFPNRLFRFDGGVWRHIEDNVRTELDWGIGNESQRSGFVNNPYTVKTTDQGNIPSRQSLSQLLEPKADNGNQGGNKPYNPNPR